MENKQEPGKKLIDSEMVLDFGPTYQAIITDRSMLLYNESYLHDIDPLEVFDVLACGLASPTKTPWGRLLHRGEFYDGGRVMTSVMTMLALNIDAPGSSLEAVVQQCHDQNRPPPTWEERLALSGGHKAFAALLRACGGKRPFWNREHQKENEPVYLWTVREKLSGIDWDSLAVTRHPNMSIPFLLSDEKQTADLIYASIRRAYKTDAETALFVLGEAFRAHSHTSFSAQRGLLVQSPMFDQRIEELLQRLEQCTGTYRPKAVNYAVGTDYLFTTPDQVKRFYACLEKICPTTWDRFIHYLTEPNYFPSMIGHFYCIAHVCFLRSPTAPEARAVSLLDCLPIQTRPPLLTLTKAMVAEIKPRGPNKDLLYIADQQTLCVLRAIQAHLEAKLSVVAGAKGAD